MYKAIVLGTGVTGPTLTPGEPQATRALCPRRTAGDQECIWAIVLQGELFITQDADKKSDVNRWKGARSMSHFSFLLNPFNPQNPLPQAMILLSIYEPVSMLRLV